VPKSVVKNIIPGVLGPLPVVKNAHLRASGLLPVVKTALLRASASLPVVKFVAVILLIIDFQRLNQKTRTFAVLQEIKERFEIYFWEDLSPGGRPI
jgi:hypothetical protein